VLTFFATVFILCFSQDVAKDDFLPESLFYLLGMKASNERAQKYQRRVTSEVLPLFRETGHYEIPNMSKEFKVIYVLDETLDKLIFKRIIVP
jgi:prophage antirepressor-like protein